MKLILVNSRVELQKFSEFSPDVKCKLARKTKRACLVPFHDYREDA